LGLVTHQDSACMVPSLRVIKGDSCHARLERSAPARAEAHALPAHVRDMPMSETYSAHLGHIPTSPRPPASWHCPARAPASAPSTKPMTYEREWPKRRPARRAHLRRPSREQKGMHWHSKMSSKVVGGNHRRASKPSKAKGCHRRSWPSKVVEGRRRSSKVVKSADWAPKYSLGVGERIRGRRSCRSGGRFAVVLQVRLEQVAGGERRHERELACHDGGCDDGGEFARIGAGAVA